MKLECPICKKQKEGIGPKVVSSIKKTDPRFAQQQLSLITVVMCNDCLEDYKQGKIELNINA